jgi:hypothetical protein
MRLLTFFAVAALACLACALQAHAGFEDAINNPNMETAQ